MAITPANEILKNQKNNDLFEKQCEIIMDDIKRASEAGYRSCYFACSHQNNGVYEAVKKEFIKNGYTIRPTGVIGGVMQTTEDICW